MFFRGAVLILVWWSTSALGATMAQVNSGYFDLDGQNPAAVRISILSEQQAIDLFRQMKNQNIPFQFAREGCYARSYAMTEYAKKQGFEMGQVVAEGQLQAQTKSELYPVAQWGHHMAPMVAVKSGDRVDIRVFDPSLFDEPVTVAEWSRKLQYDTSDFDAQITEVYYGTRFQYSHNNNEIHKNSRWPADRSNYRRDIRHFRAIEEELMGYQREALRSKTQGTEGEVQ